MSVPSPNSVKEGDTTPLIVTLSDDNGPIDLSGAGVEFRMVSRVKGSGHAPIASPAVVLQGTAEDGSIENQGEVQYAWAEGETDIPGVYGCEFQVRFADGTLRTFPNDRTVTFEIFPAAE